MIETLAVIILVVLLFIILLWIIDKYIPLDPAIKQIIFLALIILVIVWVILALTGHAHFNFG